MRLARLLVSAALAVAAFAGLHVKLGPLPPLGPFLNPFAGFWQNGRAVDDLPTSLTLPGLQDPVQIVWDDRRVPHVFARNDHDLYFAQGYLTARDRLWQMEFQTHAAAGRISEIVGEAALDFDRSRRRLGMVYGAERSVEAMRQDPSLWAMVEAYTAGVNAWIDRLGPASFPLEYKILDYAPEPWTPLKTALLLKYMSWTLTGSNNEAAMTRTRAALGDSAMAALFPFYPPFMDPVIPPDHPWRFEPLPIPSPPGPQPAATLQPAVPASPDPRNGSNNWAVDGSKTRSGHPLLANDPHLNLTLPSIWYEIQLHSPTVNVYGVSLPGSPAVIIGFNERIAWGVTNAGSDVMDWYEIEFRDERRAAYRYDGGWRPTTPRVETIRVRGGETVIDTVYYTHHGPVAYLPGEEPGSEAIPRGAALRWIAHDPSTELKTFYLLNRAAGYDDYREALRHYTSPAQNFVFADTAGTIALWHNGRFPLRWRGQGRYLSDGRNPTHDWQGWVPNDHNPGVVNPPRGFVSSANQNPTDPSYPYYLGWDYAPFERGARINERLAAMSDITPADMQALQLDDVYLHARTVLPTLLALINDADLPPGPPQDALAALRDWDYTYRAEAIAPTLYDAWWAELSRRIWQDELDTLMTPGRDVTAALLLDDPAHPFLDDVRTPQRETLRDLAPAAFEAALTALTEAHGPYGPAWALGRARGTDINHLANIPGLGRPDLVTSGRDGAVNATGRTHGPSWRMVVSLTSPVQAWGLFPGGQSGHPGSAFYDTDVDAWVRGDLHPLLLLPGPDAAGDRLVATTTLQPE